MENLEIAARQPVVAPPVEYESAHFCCLRPVAYVRLLTTGLLESGLLKSGGLSNATCRSKIRELVLEYEYCGI